MSAHSRSLHQIFVTFALLSATTCSQATAQHDGELQAVGFGFTIETLKENGLAFGNREYVFKNIPDGLQGLRFTRLNGGERASLKIDAIDRGDIYAITSEAGWPHMRDWDAVDAPGFHYTDHNESPLFVFKREAEYGDPMPVPQIGWVGTMIAQKGLTARIVEPKLDHSGVPGVVIDHIPASTESYIGSPSLAILEGDDGGKTYVASHDIFGPGSNYSVTKVFESTDEGRSWTPIADVEDAFWATLFTHRGALYMMGVSRKHGGAVIRRSNDGGRTWTTPVDDKHGLLLNDARYHCAPVPVLFHDGRIWRGMEDIKGPSGWGRCFRAFMMSAPVDADLLDANSWTCSERIGYDASRLGGRFGGWLEGNAVATPDGGVVDILRVDFRDAHEKAAMIKISADGREASFDPADGFLEFPGGCKKFTIRFDPTSKRYWTISNAVPKGWRNANPERARNTQVLMSSADLREWTIHRVVLHHADQATHGFQYLDWVFDGEDLAVVSRTAHDDGLGGAHNQHDANYMTFHRVEAFRDRSKDDLKGLEF